MTHMKLLAVPPLNEMLTDGETSTESDQEDDEAQIEKRMNETKGLNLLAIFLFVFQKMFELPSFQSGKALIETIAQQVTDGNFPALVFGLGVFASFLLGVFIGILIRSPGKMFFSTSVEKKTSLLQIFWFASIFSEI